MTSGHKAEQHAKAHPPHQSTVSSVRRHPCNARCDCAMTRGLGLTFLDTCATLATIAHYHHTMLTSRAPTRPIDGMPARPRAFPRTVLGVRVTAASEADFCPITEYEPPISPEKRQTLNMLLATTVTLPTASLLGPYATSFYPLR